MAASKFQLPSSLPIIELESRVLLPSSSAVISVSDRKGVRLVERHLSEKDWYAGIVPRDSVTEPEEELHSFGTTALVKEVSQPQTRPVLAYTLLVVGVCRFRIKELSRVYPYTVAMVTHLDSLDPEAMSSTSTKSLLQGLREAAEEMVSLLGLQNPTIKRLQMLLKQIPDHLLPDLLSSIVKGSFAEKLKVLKAVDMSDRIKATHPLVNRQLETLKLLQKAADTTMAAHPPRKPVKVKLLEELKDSEGISSDDISDLGHKIKTCGLPAHALAAANKEFKRLKVMPPSLPEYALSRNYLEYLTDLPWSRSTEDTLNIGQAKTDLEADHFGLDKAKRRILEFLAVRILKKDLKGPILCFVGAPGVGKTSIGKSVAKIMGRKFIRVSLGGVSDQSEIRGHRRTYVGSMAGRIIQGLKTVDVNNPVFLLDEVDKMTRGIHGDPAGALLEVLDPEQNNSFVDHYLGIPFDLSKVLFIATANTMVTIPPALLDRMEVIEVPGYAQEEKLEIAKHHLIPKQLAQHGLSADHLVITDGAVNTIISGYTREAGVRALERKLSALCRSAAVKVTEAEVGSVLPIVADGTFVEEVLGPQKYFQNNSEHMSRPGVAIGLAWTTFGGDIMFIEAVKMAGEGKLVLTGQLGDVMKESAQIALNWIRANASKFGIECGNLDKTDIHIHFPEGAVSKDGPSAGVTIVTVLASLFSDTCVTEDVAMTGEVTLRGVVLPVGGIKEKVLAAHRAGIRHVLLPKKNKKDLYELSQDITKQMIFTFVDRIEDVLAVVFKGTLKLTSML